jgi:hypothetical protein
MGREHNGVITMQIQYGTHALDTAKFHPTAIEAMVRRGVSHYLGNEMASKVVAWAESENKERAKTGAAPVTDAEKEAAKVAFQTDGIIALEAGTVGQSNRGPRVDPLVAQMQAIAKREVIDTLKANNIKPPKSDDVVTFGDGATRTMAQMVEKRLANHTARIEAEAKKHLSELARKADKAKKEAAARESKAPVGALELGL